jgi:HK97 family phage portal protein
MGVISKLAKATKRYEIGANYELGQSLSSNSVSNIFGSGGANIDVLEEYSGYVWKCVNTRSEDLASQNFYVERKVADKWQADPNHDFNDVLEGVDGGFDLSELLEAHQVYMDMYGESFWYFSKGETYKKPMGVYLLDPAYMTLFTQGDKVTGYVYQKDGNRITLELDEIAHFRIFNPANKFRGAGAMQKAGWFIRSSRYVTTYINNFLENNAIPAGVIVAKGDVDDTDWTLFKKQWAEKYSGIANSGKTGFVRSTDLTFVKTGLSLGDVDFEKVKNASRDDILAMFSMPLSKLGKYESFNKASATVSDTMFAKTFTKQAVTRITRRLSRKVAVWYGSEYRVGSDFAMPEDREQKLAEYDKGVGRWMTINEAREAYGLERLIGEEFDTVMPEVKASDLNTQPAAKSLTPSKEKIVVKLAPTNKTTSFTYEMKESFRSESEDLQLKYEQDFLQAANKVLVEQKKDVIEHLQPKKIVDAHIDVQKEADKLVDATLGVELALAADQGALAVAFVTNSDTAFVLTPVAEQYIKDSISKSALAFTQETVDKVAETLKTGLENGDSLPDIVKEVSKIYDDVTGVKNAGYRIERLSRTEIIKTSNEITETAYKQTGVVSKKEWLTNKGACEFCQALNGNIVQLGGTFVPLNSSLDGVDGGTRVNNYEDIQHPPVHSNCRCALIPVLEK